MDNTGLRSIILESKKIRSARGEDFFDNKKEITPGASKIHSHNSSTKIPEQNFKLLRSNHIKLSESISEYEQKIFDQNNQVLIQKKQRSKSIHLYVDETIEHFLKSESKNADTKWGLRKNAGLGQLIQKFILNFIELKKREERQLKRVKKVIDDFRTSLVEFKKYSVSPDNYLIVENANTKMKVLSNDLRILLSLLEFEGTELKMCIGNENYDWVDFILKWKLQF
jgi:hypothetical protein